jgi:hypothetical protein
MACHERRRSEALSSPFETSAPKAKHSLQMGSFCGPTWPSIRGVETREQSCLVRNTSCWDGMTGNTSPSPGLLGRSLACLQRFVDYWQPTAPATFEDW